VQTLKQALAAFFSFKARNRDCGRELRADSLIAFP
jgi:hypothetical protein